MKRFVYPVLLLAVVATVQACTKNAEDSGSAKYVTVDTALASGTEYRLDLRPYGGAGSIATIRQQGKNFTVSEIVNSPGTFAPVYRYAATTAKSNVADQVVLSVTEGKSRNDRSGCRNGDSTVITLNFTVK